MTLEDEGDADEARHDDTSGGEGEDVESETGDGGEGDIRQT